MSWWCDHSAFGSLPDARPRPVPLGPSGPGLMSDRRGSISSWKQKRTLRGHTMAMYDDSCSALAVALSAGTPVLLWGGPGVGKTSVVEQIAAHHGWHLETVIASICDPTDFKGMPRDAGDRTVFSPPEWAMRTAEAGGGRRLPRRDLHRSPVRPGGPAPTGPHRHRRRSRAPRRHPLRRSREPAQPGRRRLGPLGTPRQPVRAPRRGRRRPRSSPTGFVYGFASITVPDIHEAEAAEAVTSAMRSVGAFLTARSDLCHKMPDRSAERGMAWPSPRSWETGARLLGYAAAAHVKSGVRQKLLAGSVGLVRRSRVPRLGAVTRPARRRGRAGRRRHDRTARNPRQDRGGVRIARGRSAGRSDPGALRGRRQRRARRRRGCRSRRPGNGGAAPRRIRGGLVRRGDDP